MLSPSTTPVSGTACRKATRSAASAPCSDWRAPWLSWRRGLLGGRVGVHGELGDGLDAPRHAKPRRREGE
eukprot:7910831-Alexandrium_andersonii.AAC.1